MKAKNISRYNYKKTGFQGWRLALTRKGLNFTKYFSDVQYAGFRESFRAAVEARNAILHELEMPGADPALIFRVAKEWLNGES